ncbi:MAG TPA: polysaccharide deacetylase family protein [Casimicrobiaceae bacterium]|nr:polysaccharide deacetylase family protein [Casimicrobiaceae bacterium]
MAALSPLLFRPALHATGRGSLTILIYHRVNPSVDALFPGTADAARFDSQMSWVASALNVLPLAEAVEMLRAGRIPARAACITFDDGYADNAEVAYPILRRHGLAATFFVASGFLDGGRMWNDTVIEAIRRAPNGALDLDFLGLGRRGLDSHQSRRETIEAIIDRVKYLPQQARQERVDGLARAVGDALPRDLMMRREQVRALHAGGMEIGAHTVTHPILRALDPAQARAEIADGKAALEAITGAPVRLFAYPNGKPGIDYGPDHVNMARELGFAAALCTRHGTASASSDLFELPRFTPWGASLLRFGVGLIQNNLGHY